VASDNHEHPVFRVGGISYVRIPATDPARSAAFYEAVFGWRLRGGGSNEPSFEDGSGHVIGHFVSDIGVAGQDGVRPYIYVENLDATLAKATAEGAEVVTPPYPEGDLWVALLRDPAGNVIGAWQTAPRADT
jgi:predicted enzyme related to lactoylglutathione lyase